MVVRNSQQVQAVVIRHDGQNVRLVAMKPGRLGVSRLARTAFETEWSPCGQPLPAVLESFLEHARRQGASAEALKGLEALARRDRCVVNPLF